MVMEKRSWSNGRYSFIRNLGEGTTKEVFLVRDENLQRNVALSVFRPLMYEGFIDRARREARTLAGLTHPNIVRVYDFWEEDDCWYMTTEYVDGGDLKVKMRSDWRDSHDMREVLGVAIGVAEALKFAHENNVFHRDVKPSNIILDLNGTAKLGDFGLASPFADETEGSTGLIVGTVPYMSPEQLKGLPPDRPSDLYSFGVVLYEMVTGRRPFNGDDEEVANQILSSRPPPPSDYSLTCPPNLEALILDLLKKEPANRPSVESVIQKLRYILATLPVNYESPDNYSVLSAALQRYSTLIPSFIAAVALMQLILPLPGWLMAVLIVTAIASSCVAIASFVYHYYVRNNQEYPEVAT